MASYMPSWLLPAPTTPIQKKPTKNIVAKKEKPRQPTQKQVEKYLQKKGMHAVPLITPTPLSVTPLPVKKEPKKARVVSFVAKK